jgi:hypothetical protein
MFHLFMFFTLILNKTSQYNPTILFYSTEQRKLVLKANIRNPLLQLTEKKNLTIDKILCLTILVTLEADVI